MYFPWNYVGIYNRIKCTVFDYYPFNPTACLRADVFSRNRYPRNSFRGWPVSRDAAKLRSLRPHREETFDATIMDSDEIFK